MRIYRRGQMGYTHIPEIPREWRLTNELKPSKYAKDWEPGEIIPLANTIKERSERVSYVGIQLDEEDGGHHPGFRVENAPIAKVHVCREGAGEVDVIGSIGRNTHDGAR